VRSSPTILLSIAAGVLAIACSGAPESEAEAPLWVLSTQPILTIPDSTNPPGHEFNGVSSARRLRDHRVVIANIGAHELAVFDSSGRFQRAVGRQGQGPGEFEGPISLFAWRADSLVVYDQATLRWTFLDPGLSVTRTAPVPQPDLLQPTWLYKGAVVVDGVINPVPGWILTVLDSARGQDPHYTRLIRAWHDDAGALWIRDSGDDRRWQVYTRPGPPAGTVVLPPKFTLLQIGDDFVLGQLQDSLDIEEIRAYSLQRPEATGATPDSTPTQVPTEPAMLQPIRDLMVAQEVYYSSHASYAGSADSLKLSTPFPGRLFLIAGDSRHWAAVSVRPETGATCGLSVGWPAPLGWLDGSPFCGR
jgi:6-bladed beta-propeller protein